MLTSNAVLALILTVAAPPGRSAHSRVEVAPDTYRLETRAEGLDRYRIVARAIAEASKGNLRMARILVTIAEHESSFRRDIHSCEKLGDRGHSYSVFQIRYGKKSKRGAAICGLDYDSTLRAARAAAKHVGRTSGQLCSSGPSCVAAFIRYSGLPRIVATTDPRYASKIAARARTYAATATPLPLPVWATLDG